MAAKQLTPEEWIGVYFDNPDVTQPEALRCDTMISVDPAFEIPPNRAKGEFNPGWWQGC
ncbi:hypothetical protein GIX45_11910 [Erwinia sp. CPCC 100877]|nr:hypothetical protein [Erwinia sp. CPCC 100877]